VPGAPPADTEARGSATPDGRDRSAARAAAFARSIAERFQPIESNPVTETPSQPRTWADSIETPRTGRPLARELFVSAGGVVAPVPAPPSASILSPTAAVQVIQASQATGLDAEAGEALRSQIIQTMRLQHQGAGGDAHIRLQPHYLGDLTISLRVEQGGVTAHLTAGQADVRQGIEANETMLRQHLAQHDLTLERLTVAEEEPATPQRDADHGEGRRETPPKPRRRRPDTDATFEVVV
jgi:flagellar hook-length control protein FliK